MISDCWRSMKVKTPSRRLELGIGALRSMPSSPCGFPQGPGSHHFDSFTVMSISQLYYLNAAQSRHCCCTRQASHVFLSSQVGPRCIEPIEQSVYIRGIVRCKHERWTDDTILVADCRAYSFRRDRPSITVRTGRVFGSAGPDTTDFDGLWGPATTGW